MLEAIGRFEELVGRRLRTEYVDEPRRGDHICYVSDVRRLGTDFPGWEISVDRDSIVVQLARHQAGSP